MSIDRASVPERKTNELRVEEVHTDTGSSALTDLTDDQVQLLSAENNITPQGYAVIGSEEQLKWWVLRRSERSAVLFGHFGTLLPHPAFFHNLLGSPQRERFRRDVFGDARSCAHIRTFAQLHWGDK